MAARSASGMTAPRPSIFSNCADHCWRVRCCSVMRPALWHEVQAALIFGCIGPAGSGLPGALGAWALARIPEPTRDTKRDAKKKIAGILRCNTRSSPQSHGWCRLESPRGALEYRSIWQWAVARWAVITGQVFLGKTASVAIPRRQPRLPSVSELLGLDPPISAETSSRNAPWGG